MNLANIVNREACPEPWSEVSKIPWDDPEFSARMLREHLSQEHDAASRRAAIIDDHVRWIHAELLGGRPSRVLDLGCGPGLYCVRLARAGHACTGIDFGPASIDYARASIADDELDCDFLLGDLREGSYGENCDLIMLLFGEFNTFQRSDALSFLMGSREALAPGGSMVIEGHTLDSIRAKGEVRPAWSAVDAGLFSDRPYLRLDDACWHDDGRTSVERHFVIDATTGEVSLYGTTTQAYTREEYRELLHQAGFRAVTWRNDWPNDAHSREFELIVATP